MLNRDKIIESSLEILEGFFLGCFFALLFFVFPISCLYYFFPRISFHPNFILWTICLIIYVLFIIAMCASWLEENL